MCSLTSVALESNKYQKINFDGGDLSSDAGLLLLKEFASRIGFDRIIRSNFKTNDDASFRFHTDYQNLMQMIYQILSAYYTDDCADELTTDPVMTAILDKDALASQPTLSRFFNRMDDDTLDQLNRINAQLRKRIYSIQKPERLLLDLDSTLLPTYGMQEGGVFNFHYQADGYHPIVCYEGITGDLLKILLRKGADYSCTGVKDFLEPLLDELQDTCPDTPLALRGDSGFATPELYDLCEERNVKYAIRLKENSVLKRLCADEDAELYRAVKKEGDSISYAVTYGEFMYQAKTWNEPRRVVFKIEKPYNQIIHMYTFIVTNMEELQPYQVIQYYCGRGRMENFIKESKDGFDFAAVSGKLMTVNANRVQIHALAYNLFNWFRRIALPISMRKQRVDTIRLKLLKIAARVVHSARYITFKLCSSCPYQQEFFETLANIRKLQANPQLE